VLFILIIWSSFNLFALLLVGLRRDFNAVFEDLLRLLFPGKFYLSVLGFVAAWLILPFSIPYSIAHFLRK
jgi:hypothetical protein